MTGRPCPKCGATERYADGRCKRCCKARSRRYAKANPERTRWEQMWQRCINPNATDYAIYGGRGITVCRRWCKFANYVADMGPRPPGTSLDRIDPDGDYTPRNCRWATASEQRRNRRR